MLHNLPCEALMAEPGTPSKPERLRVGLLSAAAAASHIEAWRALAANCLEPNVFFEPGFVLPAAKHLANSRAPRFLFVWQGDKLAALCQLAPPGALARFLPARIWTHKQAPLGTPLLDPTCAEEALAAILAYCRANEPYRAGLMFPMLAQDGPAARLLTAAATAEGRNVARFDPHQRAVLVADGDPKHYLKRSLSSARRRKLNKARESLEAMGKLSLRIVRDARDIPSAAEEFFQLEAKGWKGRRGTALVQSPERAIFAREIASNLGSEGKYFVASLDLDGRPLAMALLLESGDRGFWWKIAYDEDFAAFSPGVLLAKELTRALLEESRLVLIDSCTAGDQPMIDHVWAERMPIADLFVCTAPDRNQQFSALAGREGLRRTLRRRLKALVSRLRLGRPRGRRQGPASSA